MPDMLVDLQKLPSMDSLLKRLKTQGVVIRRSHVFETTKVLDWVTKEFSRGWADEVAAGHANKPVTVFVAVRDGELLGFGAYECTRRNYFGPTGVSKKERGKGIGQALLLASLFGLKEMGYAYCIIGGAGPTEFYSRCVGATVIPDSVPGIYVDQLKKPPKAARRKAR